MRFTPLHRDQGFSMPEVMISSMLLAMVVVNSTNIYMRSQGNIRTSSLRDAVNARIAEDLEQLRQMSWSWACEPGAGCDGDPNNTDQPLNYQTARAVIDPNAPAPRNEYLAACGHNVVNPSSSPNDAYLATTGRPEPTLAVVMKSNLSLPSGPTTIPWNQGNTVQHVQNVTLKREILASGNELHVRYFTDPTTPINVQLNSTLVPQAVGWCP